MMLGLSFSAPHNLILFLFQTVELGRNQLFGVIHLVALESIVVRINESLERIFQKFLVFQVSVNPTFSYIGDIKSTHSEWIIAKKLMIISNIHR